MKKIFFFFLISSFSLFGDFFQTHICSSEKFSEELQEKTLDMTWNFGSNSYFFFLSENEEVYFEISFADLPENFEPFLEKMKEFCIEKEGKVVFSYRLLPNGEEKINAFNKSRKHNHPDEYPYIIASRRIVPNATPNKMSADELQKIIHEKKVLFYTGAGLSRASNIPAMSELNDLLGIEMGEKVVYSLENAIRKPRLFAKKIQSFHKACLFSPPTPAHMALKDLVLIKSAFLVTENLDCLHEASGIYPYRINPKQLRNEVGGESIAAFDYIICIGLSFDDRGFLGWFKEQSPEGKIIAIDLAQPCYLGDEDFFVEGDLQTLIPNVQKEIVKLATNQS